VFCCHLVQCASSAEYALCALQVLDVNFFDAAPFLTYDVITLGMILHDWGLQKKKLLMKKVRRDITMPCLLSLWQLQLFPVCLHDWGLQNNKLLM
jgi:hypothetical protein